MPYDLNLSQRTSGLAKLEHTSPRAFSLIELLVVLVIIGLLAGLVTINVRGYLIRAKQNAARSEIATICDALESYYTLHDHYPTNAQGLQVLSTAAGGNGQPLLKQSPIDPWNRSYQYNQPGRDNQPYEVFTLGADGREGGTGVDTDIGSWNLKKQDQPQ